MRTSLSSQLGDAPPWRGYPDLLCASGSAEHRCEDDLCEALLNMWGDV